MTQNKHNFKLHQVFQTIISYVPIFIQYILYVSNFNVVYCMIYVLFVKVIYLLRVKNKVYSICIYSASIFLNFNDYTIFFESTNRIFFFKISKIGKVF